MMQTAFPENYEQWHHCITVECGIPLTTAFVTQRLATWRDTKLDETIRFRRLYGDTHWQSVISWFEHAERKLTSTT